MNRLEVSWRGEGDGREEETHLLGELEQRPRKLNEYGGRGSESSVPRYRSESLYEELFRTTILGVEALELLERELGAVEGRRGLLDLERKEGNRESLEI